MNVTSIIARKYLFSRKNVSLINTLTLISISGVTVGTCLLIVVLSVFNGFFDVIKKMLLSNDPDIRIESAENPYFLPTESLEQILTEIPEISVKSPYIQGKALLSHRLGNDQVVMVKGIDPLVFAQFSEIPLFSETDMPNLGIESGRPGLIAPEVLGRALRLQTGSEVSLISASGMQRALTHFTGPRANRFEIRGIYDLHQVVDDPVVYIDITAARRLFDTGNAISGIDLRLKEHHRADAVKSMLQSRLSEDFHVQTWYDLQRPLYEVMNLEKWGAYFILMIIILVAVLNIVGSLTMIVIQKKRDIGLLCSIGFRRKDILNLFLKQGWYIGLLGGGLGTLLGLLLALAQKEFEWVKLAGSESFIISAYPIMIQWPDVLYVLGGSLLLCLAASAYPALRAASIHPADALRND